MTRQLPFLTKLFAFLWKDWEQARSYRLAFVLQFVTALLPLAGLYFLNRLFHQVDISSLSSYGGNYVAFVLVGLAITTYSFTALRAFSANLRAAQFSGTLEVLLLTRASLPTMIFGWSLYPFIRATITMVVMLVGGFVIIGLRFDNMNVLGALLTLVLSVVIMGSLGILAASFTLVFKQGDPFTGAIVLASGMLSGTLYPVGVLPEWLQVVAKLLPHTHAMEAMRLAVLRGYPIGDLLPQLHVLAAYAILLPMLGMWAFSYAMYRAKLDGSLAHY